MQTVKLQWEKYKNFFQLRSDNMREPRLVYVVGSNPYCYIGSIGADEGKQGIGTRYQHQYLKLGKAIFGLGEENAVECHAARFIEPKNAIPELIKAVEAHVQDAFIAKYGKSGALFEPIDSSVKVKVTHHGILPDFVANRK